MQKFVAINEINPEWVGYKIQFLASICESLVNEHELLSLLMCTIDE